MRSAAIFAAGVLLGFCVAIGFSGRAQDWLVGSGIALHLGGGSHCNDLTTGLGYEGANLSAGFYRNSNCKWSTYLARVYTPLSAQIGAYRAKFGALVGGVTGYDRPITPVAGFAAAIEGERYGLNIVYVPPFSGSGNVLWFSVKRRW